jgi:glycosyltransferase involved in cell wall biosynthesis
MWMHGEPLSSVGNGVSMKAICDLAPSMDCFIAMRKEEMPIWNSIKRTYLVPKGIDLEKFTPIDMMGLKKLEGSPAILYVENWRGSRNPLYLCRAMEEVHKKLPDARLHLVNCKDQKMKETFQALIKQCRWWPFIRTLMGPVVDVNQLYNRVDMVVSGLFPLYARGIEAFGAGKAFIGAGYKETGYPWQCELDPMSIADTIVKCWENYDLLKYRQWAKERHDVAETVRQSIEIYQRFL